MLSFGMKNYLGDDGVHMFCVSMFSIETLMIKDNEYGFKENTKEKWNLLVITL